MFYAAHPEEGFFEIVSRVDRVPEVTKADIRSLARRVLPADHYIDIRLVPIGVDQ